MSSSARIPVSSNLRESFDSATKGESIRYIKVCIENEELISKGVGNATGNAKDDFVKVASEISGNVPFFVCFNTDLKQKRKWAMIAFVPADSKIKDRMLYGASRETLKKELGSENFSGEYFCDRTADLTWDNFQLQLTPSGHKGPITEKEAHKAMADQLEAEERNRASASGSKGSGSVPFQLTENAKNAVTKLTTGNVTLFIDLTTEAIELSAQGTEGVNSGDISSRLSGDRPLYLLVKVDNHLVLVYYCPEKAPVRAKMVASTGKSALIRNLQDIGLNVVRSLECSEGKEITADYIKSEVESATAEVHAGDAPSVARVSRPARPGKGGARLTTKN